MSASTPVVAGDRAELEISGLSTGGDGVGRLADGCVIFVPGTAPRDRVAVRIVSRKKRFARGVVEELLVASESRVEPRCPYIERCGGCQWQHVSYDEQLRQKQGLVAHRVERLGASIEPIIPSPDTYGYRCRVRLRFEASDAGVRLGFRGARSHELVEIERCAIAHERINEALAALVAWLAPLRGGGELELLSNGLETGAAARCDAGAVLPSTLAPLPDCLVGLRLVPRRGAPLQLGAAHLRFGVLDVPLGGFWQSNGRGNELLVEELRKAALELAPLGGRVLELYCGAGNLTRVLAESSTHLVAVEASADAIAALNRRADMATVASAGSAPSAVSDAGHAASGLSATTLAGSAAAGKTSGTSVGAASSSIWGTSQIELHAQPVERFLAACRADFDWVVLDPPRSGAAVAIPELVRLRPRGVIYISCDLHTAARDIEQLLGAGYELTRVQPIDMFPQTYHVETIFVLRDAH